MQATFRFWRSNQPKNGFQGKIWMDVQGVEISGSVMVGKNGLYSDFRNSPKLIDEDNKITYGKPIVQLSDEVFSMVQAVTSTFWSNPQVTTVTIISEDGKLKLVKGTKSQTKSITAIEGAEQYISAAEGQTTIQSMSPSQEVKEISIEDSDLPM